MTKSEDRYVTKAYFLTQMVVFFVLMCGAMKGIAWSERVQGERVSWQQFETIKEMVRSNRESFKKHESRIHKGALGEKDLKRLNSKIERQRGRVDDLMARMNGGRELR